jgi:hypothetical protein
MPAMTSALSAICGTHLGLTKLVTSISFRPASCRRCTRLDLDGSRHGLLFVLQAVARADVDQFDFDGMSFHGVNIPAGPRYRQRVRRVPARWILPAIWAMLSSRSVRAEVWGVTVIFGCRQNGWLRRQRFGAEHVQRGAGQVAAVQQRDQVVIHQMGAARHVDDIAAGLQARQRVAAGCRACRA